MLFDNKVNKSEHDVLLNLFNNVKSVHTAKTLVDTKVKFGEIKCNDSGNIEIINLPLHGLNESIHSLVENLLHLKILNLSSNKLRGPIPSSIGSLVHLKRLDLSNNELSGSVPASIGYLVHLDILDLSSNELSGPIPSSIKELKCAKNFDKNTGFINKSEYDILLSLAKQWDQNAKTFINKEVKSGKIKYKDGGCIISIDLSSNKLRGPIHSSIGSLVHLKRLDLSNNELSGSVPASIGYLVHLDILDLSSNELSGPIPSSIKELKCAKNFDKNTGFINKSEYDILLSLAKQWDQNAKTFINKEVKSGKIKYTTSGCIISIDLSKFSDSTRRRLKLGLDDSRDKLEGPIASSVGSLANLVTLDLSSNILKGSIPSSVWDLVRLKTLNLSENKLSGSIPASVGALADLKTLNLSSNRLGGSIPSSVGALVHLTTLNLSSNKLVGSIPTSLGSLPLLLTLDLSENSELSGFLPPMVSKTCEINAIYTKIVVVEVKTQPLRNWYDILFGPIAYATLGYVDLVLDVLAIISLSTTDRDVMFANVTFIVSSVLLGVLTYIKADDLAGALRVLLQVDKLYQCYRTVTDQHETTEMIFLKKLDSITRSVPGMILQLYGLLKVLSESKTSKSYSTQILVLSLASSVAGVGFTLASLSPDTGDRIFSCIFIKYFTYYMVEVTMRVVTLGVLFFKCGAVIIWVVVFDFVERCVLLVRLTKSCDLCSVSLLAVQSLGSDHTVPSIEYYVFLTATLECIASLTIMLKFDTVEPKGARFSLAIVLGFAWLVRLAVLLSSAMRRVPESMASKEEGRVGSVSLNRISDSQV